MRAVIFANGQLTRPILLQPDDLVIAADGGTHHCLGLGIRPQVVIGDLDSVREDELEELSASGTEIIIYPERKDFTDLELALRHALELGAEEALVLGGLGARWDQTLANLLLPVAPGLERLRIRIADGAQEMLLLRAGEALALPGEVGDTVSLLPLGGPAQGICTQGLEYPLRGETLEFGSTRGISNVIIELPARLSFENGLLLVVVLHTSGLP